MQLFSKEKFLISVKKERSRSPVDFVISDTYLLYLVSISLYLGSKGLLVCPLLSLVEKKNLLLISGFFS